MTSLLGTSRMADIRFHRNGTIDITAAVAKILQLDCGDVIDIMYNDNTLLLYVKHRSPVHGRHEARVFRTNNRGKHYRAHSVKLCRAVMKIIVNADRGQMDEDSNVVGVFTEQTPVVNDTYGIMVPLITRYINKQWK